MHWLWICNYQQVSLFEWRRLALLLCSVCTLKPFLSFLSAYVITGTIVYNDILASNQLVIKLYNDLFTLNRLGIHNVSHKEAKYIFDILSMTIFIGLELENLNLIYAL
jgi:hypothetical protein